MAIVESNTQSEMPEVPVVPEPSGAPIAPMPTAPVVAAPRGAGHWVRALIVGLIGGAVATSAMLLVFGLFRIVLGIPTPPESIPDRLAPVLRIPEFFSLFDRFGGYNGLKRLGVTSMLAGMIAVGFLLSILYALAVENSRTIDPARRYRRGIGWAALGMLAVALALVAVLSLGVVAPVLATNFRGLSPGPATAATVIGWLVAYLTFGVSLVLVCRLMTNPAPMREASPLGGELLARRSLLAIAAAVVGTVATGGILRTLNAQAVFTYDGNQYRGTDLQPITPNDRFYSVTKNVVDPTPTKTLWRLEVGGDVTNGRAYTFDELAALPNVEQETTLMCISNGVDGGLMSNARWRGVPLATVLGSAALKPGVTEVKLSGADGYTDTIPLAKALDPTTLLVYTMNGEPIPQKHGYPVRVIVPGMYGEKNVKWVTRIEPVIHPVQGFYEQQGWGPDFTVHTRARIDAPDPGRPVPAGMPVDIRGIALGGDRGVSRVEVSTDDGRTWQDARIEYPGTKLSWAFWRFPWQPTGPGEYHVLARATDGMGGVQAPEVHDIVPQGARGYHRVTLRVQ